MGEKDKIRQFLDYKGISKNKFYTQTGLSVGFLDSGKSLGVDKMRIIINTYPELNMDWLVMGRGPMIKEEQDIQTSSLTIAERFPLRTDRDVDIQSIPLYEMDATAGLVSLFDTGQQIPVSHLAIPNLPPCDGALYVRGDSMYPLLKSGDIVLYRQVVPSMENILWGEMYLLSFTAGGEDFITIKYIQKAEAEGYVRLVSHNPHHSPKDIPADTIRALALIKASVRYNTMG